MRAAKRVDSNQRAIVQCLRDMACVVEVLSDVGRGVADLIVKTPRGTVLWVECKDGDKPPSARRLTLDEQAFAARWGSSYVVVTSVEDAARVASR